MTHRLLRVIAGPMSGPCVSKDARVPLQYVEITSGQRAPGAEGRAGVLARHPGVGQLAPGQHPRAQVVHHVDAFVAVHQQHRVTPAAVEPAGGEGEGAAREGVAAHQLAQLADGEVLAVAFAPARSEEHTSELPSLMRISSAVFCLKTQTPSYHIDNLRITICTRPL